MRGDSFFGDAMHLFGADLHFELMAAFANHRGVQGLIAVGAGNCDEVLDAAGHGTPQRVNQTEDRVTRGDVLGDDADGEEIVDLVERNLGPLQLLVDGIEALDAPLHARLDVVFAKLLGKHVFDVVQELFAIDAACFDCLGKLLVADRIGVTEGEVFKFAAYLTHSEAVCQRRIDVEGLAGDSLLPIGLEVLEGAHVMQPVGKLDQHHADVADHGEKHLADVLGLAVFAVRELDFVDLGDALDDVGHLIAEAGFDLLAGRRRVFDGVVQKARGDGCRVELHFGQNFGNFKRMNDIGLARGAHLALVVLDAELPGFADEADVIARAIGLDSTKKCFEALVDRFLVGARSSMGTGFRARRGGAGKIRRELLPDSRHTSL